MTQAQTRPPTPAKSWVHPLAELSGGNLYPYWNLKASGLTPYFDVLRRTFAAVNPFAYQQVPTNQRMGMNIKFGDKFYAEEPYPSATVFTHRGPAHYNPLQDPRFKQKPHTDHVHLNLGLNIEPLVPRFCEREIRTYKRCVVANDNREDVCKHEQENIVAVCPLWALNNLKQKKLAELKDQAQANLKYKQVMEVPYYNKGRTVADVPLKSWQDGSRENLRPDTLWADDRYADITSEEVKAAKQRVDKRRAAHPAKKIELPTYDRTYEAPSKQVPLYSFSS